MVTQRRIGPLYLVLAAGLLLVIARAFQVQVLEHGIWANEASGMLRGSELLPYHRGRIVDRKGVVLARDEDRREIELCYRDFRRGNPIAEVAHARSVLEMRAVGLREAEEHLEAWALELVQLTPRELDAFAHGAALAIGAAPALDPEQAKAAQRDRRAADLRYYAAELLELVPRRRKDLVLAKDDPRAALSLLELAAQSREQSREALSAELALRLADARAELGRLAALVERDSKLAAGEGANPLERLLATLERERRAIEDETADALFRAATGFDPGRVRTRVLETRLDTSWIARSLYWDDARWSEWRTSRRKQWEENVAEVLLPRALARTEMEELREQRADRLLSELALLWGPGDEELRRPDGRPRSWRELEDLCVLCEFDSLFDLPSGVHLHALPRNVLPFQDPSVDELARSTSDHWRVLGAIADLARGRDVGARVRNLPAGWRPPAGPLEAALRWSKLGAEERRVDTDEALVELSWLFFALEERFQDTLEREFERLYEPAAAHEPFAFDANRLSQATEAERFLVKDKSTRALALCSTPSWELVELVARHASAFRGFDLRASTQRVNPEHDSSGAGLASPLLGSVRKLSLTDLLKQGSDARRLSELRNQLARSSEEQAEIHELAARLYRSDEWTGGSGLESYLDPELRGTNGFQETLSLSDEVEAAGSELARAPIDGREVVLTLRADLQRAAQDTLAHPVMPGGDQSDQLWCQNPVGAIVLITPEGEVLAAASEPTRDHLPRTPGRDAERSHLRERTMQRATINPPGSAFKSFMAAYALDRLQFDPERKFACSQLPDGGWGYQTLHCHGPMHGSLAMHAALARSCNAYFGQLAEAAFKPADFVEMAHVFGFGEPTGIRFLGTKGRSGLREDWLLPYEAELPTLLSDRAMAMRFACGLAPMEATPMQVARATAGLIHGVLPELSLVHSIGGALTPHRSRPLGISAGVLSFVRDALDAVVNEPGGTAFAKNLDEQSLGFRFACKTGSADIRKFADSPELTAADRADMQAGKWRKHTWIAGWFPEEHPRAVLVVYLHDVSETASHSAVWVAAQFLRQDAVRRFACDDEDAR